MKGAPRSKQFDDVYFSAQDGLAETEHVFLKSNNLPHAWQERENFTIAETGLGTGLNVLSAMKLFQETAKKTQRLNILSFEKYPLAPEEIRSGLAPWKDHFKNELDLFLDHYPARLPGFHKIVLNEQITLTLVFDDVNESIPQAHAVVDCWFLDGFKPSSNPKMWTDVVFENMARMSRPGTTFATFTAAGAVKRGLQAAGFDVKKVAGFGTKRDMLVGEKL